jgi:hypothetical protein
MPRDPSPELHRSAVCSTAEASPIALVVADTAAKWPLVEEVTADFVYLRMHGDKKIYVSGYTTKSLCAGPSGFADGAGQRAGGRATHRRRKPPPRRPRDVYCYFDNDVKVKAPRDASVLRNCWRAGRYRSGGTGRRHISPPRKCGATRRLSLRGERARKTRSLSIAPFRGRRRRLCRRVPLHWKSRCAARPAFAELEPRRRCDENALDVLARTEQQHVREHVECAHDADRAKIASLRLDHEFLAAKRRSVKTFGANRRREQCVLEPFSGAIMRAARSRISE